MSAWAEIIGQVKKESRAAWMVAFTLTVMDLTDDVLTLKFLSQKDLDSFKSDSRSTDALRKAIFADLLVASEKLNKIKFVKQNFIQTIKIQS
jgi:hypothetical protein